MAGKTVQTVSISWASIKYLLNFLEKSKEINKYKVKMVIKDNTIIAWSWKNRIFSITGEILSWNEIAIQNGINCKFWLADWKCDPWQEKNETILWRH